MKTEEISFVFTKEDVRKYCEAIGVERKLYTNEAYAKEKGLPTIPLPPMMPVITYKLLEIPWKQNGVMIHRKQECTTFIQLFIAKEYTTYLSLTNVVHRREYTFMQENLVIHDEWGRVCFSSTTHIAMVDRK